MKGEPPKKEAHEGKRALPPSLPAPTRSGHRPVLLHTLQGDFGLLKKLLRTLVVVVHVDSMYKRPLDKIV